MKYLFFLFIILISTNISLIADSQGGRQIAGYDIEDFRLGDSLLDKYSESFIEDHIIDIDYLDTSYIVFYITDQDKKMYYDNIQIILKSKDKDYLIHGISAQKNMNFNSCMTDMRNIDEELNSIFVNAQRKYFEEVEHIADTSGKSYESGALYLLRSGDAVSVQCQNWSDKTPWFDALKHEIMNQKAALWAAGQ